MTRRERLRAARWPLLLYNLLYPFVLLAMLPVFCLRMLRRGNYRHKFGQRFGIYSRRVRKRVAGRPWTWVHAVSVGECLIALKLIDRLKARDPSLQVVLATTTSTGFALARDAAADRDWMEVIYNPLDFVVPVAQAFSLFRPIRLILVEAEVWPNTVAHAVRRNVPVFLVNARISPRSESRFRRGRALAGPVFGLLDLISVQEGEDVDRWIALGARPDQIRLSGSIKFDQPPPGPSREEEFRALLTRLGVSGDAPILLGGSTFAGEEKILVRVFLNLREMIPNLFLILVPRHFERAPEILRDLEPLGLSIQRRTALDSGASTLDSRPDVLLVDTTGELRDWYRLATVVFIGKSLRSTGGQNPVEAVIAGSPVVFGPHMENFRAIVRRWKETDAAVEIADAESLERELLHLLQNPARRADLIRRARAAVDPHQGATERTASMILEFPA